MQYERNLIYVSAISLPHCFHRTEAEALESDVKDEGEGVVVPRRTFSSLPPVQESKRAGLDRTSTDHASLGDVSNLLATADFFYCCSGFTTVADLCILSSPAQDSGQASCPTETFVFHILPPSAPRVTAVGEVKERKISGPNTN